MIQILTVLIAVVSGVFYFVLSQGYWLLLALFVLIIFTRFNKKYRHVGGLAEIIFLFCLTSTVINEMGIYYPYSLIIIMTILVMLIFLEGPAWGKLYFGAGKTVQYFRQSLLFAGISILTFGIVIFIDRNTLQNPVPLNWPLDSLIVVGVGFAFYLAIIEETIFRSFILQRAEAAAGLATAIVVQGVFFGFMFYKSGIPGNYLGILLGSGFGIGLGYLVKKTGSVYLSMLVRFIVTLAIFLELTILGKFTF